MSDDATTAGVRVAVSALRQSAQIDKLAAWQLQRTEERSGQLTAWAKEYCATDGARCIVMPDKKTTLRYKPPGTRLAITAAGIRAAASDGRFFPSDTTTPQDAAMFEALAEGTLRFFAARAEPRSEPAGLGVLLPKVALALVTSERAGDAPAAAGVAAPARRARKRAA